MRALLPALAIFVGWVESAASQTLGTNSNPYFYSNQTYTYGMNLPQVPIPHGQDEVRSADGTTCRSSMSSNSAYLDVGAIGSQGYGGEFDQGTFYGRIIVPLGETPRRIDCTKLYELEIQRLRHELSLVRAGVGSMTPLAADGQPVTNAAVGAAPAVADEPPSKAAVKRRSDKAAAKSKSKTAGASSWANSGWGTSGWKERSNLGAPIDNAVPAAPRQRERRGANTTVAADITRAAGWEPVVVMYRPASD
ncbi:MAG: hypothetical protein AB7E80_03355 [Hyphomicrobiaceae bacterium]